MKTDINYVNDLESLLYYANRKVEMLSRPYDVVINDREEEIRSLKELQELLKGVEQPVNIKIKTKRLGQK
jgi:hypothetical protein